MAASIAVPSAHRKRGISTSINRRLPWLRNQMNEQPNYGFSDQWQSFVRERNHQSGTTIPPLEIASNYMSTRSTQSFLTEITSVKTEITDRFVEDTNCCCALDASTLRTYGRYDKSSDYCVCNCRYKPSRFRTCISKLPRFSSVDSYTGSGADTNT